MTIYKDQLEAVYKLIERPENWQQRSYNNAVWNEGAQGDLWLQKAPTCFCLAGAIQQVTAPNQLLNIFQQSLAHTSLSKALGFKEPTELFDFNDTHTHAEVLALLASAIERAPVRP